MYNLRLILLVLLVNFGTISSEASLDIFPFSWGNQNVVFAVIKNLNKALGSDIAERFGKEIHNVLKNKKGFEKGWRMVNFISTEMSVVSKIIKNPDDMTQLAHFFTKYGDEGSALLKKFGDDLADEAFEVYKKGGELKETLDIVKNRPLSQTIWLEIGDDIDGFQHIIKKHFKHWVERYPGI
jgi:hypothetical protein